MKTLGNRLKLIRKNLEFTQKEFANVINVPFTAISKYERDEIKPSSIILERIHNKFNININWLITGEGDMFITTKSKSEYTVNGKKVIYDSDLQFIIDYLKKHPKEIRSIAELIRKKLSLKKDLDNFLNQ